LTWSRIAAASGVLSGFGTMNARRRWPKSGSSTRTLERLADWRDQGMAYPVLLNMGLLQPNLATGVLTNVAYAQLLRRIRKLGPARARQYPAPCTSSPFLRGCARRRFCQRAGAGCGHDRDSPS
jgi:hypothetical protein